MDTKEKVMRRRSQDRIRGYFYKTKDELLRSDLYKRSASARRHIQRTLDVFAHLLVQADHFGQLFNRAWPQRHASVAVVAAADDVDASTAASLPKKRRREAVQALCQRNVDVLPPELLVSLCDSAGRFRCQGLWNELRCGYAASEHSINPYASREAAILFQIWNLDHGAELTRTVVPDLLRSVQALTQPDGRCRRHGRRVRELGMLRYFRELFTLENLRLVHIVCHDKAIHAERKSSGGVLCEECEEFEVVRELCAAVATE